MLITQILVLGQRAQSSKQRGTRSYRQLTVSFYADNTSISARRDSRDAAARAAHVPTDNWQPRFRKWRININARTTQVPCFSQRLRVYYCKTRPVDIFNEKTACENEKHHAGVGFNFELTNRTHILPLVLP
jgi:hypothetical protein